MVRSRYGNQGSVRLSKHTLGALFVQYRDVDSEEESDSENDKETEN